MHEMARSSMHNRFIPDSDSVYLDKGAVSLHDNVVTDGINVWVTYDIHSARNTWGEVSRSSGRGLTTLGIRVVVFSPTHLQILIMVTNWAVQSEWVVAFVAFFSSLPSVYNKCHI